MNADRTAAIAAGRTTYIGKTHPICGTAERYLAGGCVHCKTAARRATVEKRATRAREKQVLREAVLARKAARKLGRVERQRIAATAKQMKQMERTARAEAKADRLHAMRHRLRMCAECADDFDIFGRPGALTCSPECAREYQKKADRAERGKRAWKDRHNAKMKLERDAARPPRICITCEDQFDAAAGRRFYARTCSALCSKIAYRCEAVARAAATNARCPACGCLFRSNRRTTCSEGCDRVLRAKPPASCQQCGDGFFAVGKRTDFCSDVCSDKHRAERKSQYDRKYRLTYPEVRRQRKRQDRITHLEARRAKGRAQQDKRRQRNSEALAVAAKLIPDTLAAAGNRLARIATAVEFTKSIGLHQTGETNVTVRHA